MHNDLLRYVSNSFVETKSISTRANGIDYILKLQQEGVNTLNISSVEKEFIKKGLEQFKDLYETENIYKYISVPTKSYTEDADDEITTSEIKQLIHQAYITNEIDQFEYDTFNELIDCVVANAQGTIGNNEFEVKINSLISTWEIKYKDIDFSAIENEELTAQTKVVMPSGALSGTVLSLSKSSLEYWNSAENLVETKAVPAFVGADIAGAIVGACTATAGQLLITGDINAKGILWGAGCGAITGSTGIVGKIGKWISKLL